MMRFGLLFSLFSVSQADFDFDVKRLKKAAEIILVNGLHTSRPKTGWVATTENVVQGLNVQMSFPNVPQFPEKGADADSCNRDWFCEPKTIDLCPGQLLNSVETYDQPTFKWKAEAEFYYSLFLVDLFSPTHAKLAGRPDDSIAAKINWGVLNIKGSSDISKGTELNDWDRPKNPFMEPALFVYLLFAHGKPIEAAWVTAANGLPADATKVDLQKYISSLGLSGRHLAGFTFFKVQASAFTHTSGEVAKDPSLCTHLLQGKPEHGQLDMCDSAIEVKCAAWTKEVVAPTLPSTKKPPVVEGSSPPDENAALLEGKLKAMLGAQGRGGKLGSLFESSSSASLFLGGAVVSSVLVSVVLACLALWSRRRPTQMPLLAE